jgi:hypothetical protein
MVRPEAIAGEDRQSNAIQSGHVAKPHHPHQTSRRFNELQG